MPTSLSSLAYEYQSAFEKSVPALAEILRGKQDLIFPNDVLYGASPESRYRNWIDHQLKPRLRNLGREGQLWWNALTKVDLSKDPELLWRVSALISVWFFPEFHEHLQFAETVILLAIIRKLAADEDLGK